MITNQQFVSASQYGTPLYIYDGDLISKRYQELYDFISYPNLQIYYALKANYNPQIVKLLAENGSGIDAVSPGEVHLALKLGVDPEKIIFTANNLTDAEIKEVGDLGILFNLGSLSELTRFGQMFPNRSVCVRFNPDVVAGAHAKIQTGGALTKFGIMMDDLDAVKDIAKKFNLKIVGLHKHTGSGIKETDKYLEAARNILNLATPANFPDLEFVDFGGGFAVPYHEDEKRIDYVAFGAQVSELVLGAAKRFTNGLKLFFEPGKYLVAEAGNLLIRVNTLKNNRGRLIAGTDSGFNHLIRPVLYEAYHAIENLSNPTGSLKTYDIAGNICETGDLFAKDRQLPEIREGDLLLIRNAGAYGFSMGGIYNLRAMPAEVIYQNNEFRICRRRETSAELAAKIIGESF